MTNPFKKITTNAETTKKEWKGLKAESTTKAKQCHRCGAPRPTNTNLVACAYCGTPFMLIDATIEPDA